MKKKIVIFGAGVGGLTTAHELSKYPDEYHIEIYEIKNEIGGLARSTRDMDGCATEYCWRVYFNFYHNLFKIFSEIPLIINENKTILDNLDTYKHINIIDHPISFYENVIAGYKILEGLCSCDARLNDLDELTWWEALQNIGSSNLYREIGGWLGMDRYKGSYKSVIKVGMEMQILPSRTTSNYSDWITIEPTSEAWFDHWENLLKKRGVIFHMNTGLKSVNISDGIIKSTLTSNGKLVEADYYILSIPVEAIDKIIDNVPQMNIGTFKYIKLLTNTCLHTQLSFQVYFNCPISLGLTNKNMNNNAFLVVESPWDLIILSYDKAYDLSKTKLCYNIPNVRGGWSIAACTAYIPGIIYHKPMLECSYEEIIKEIWAQLIRSEQLQKLIKKYNGFELTNELIVKWSPLWSTFDSKNDILITSEPKFTNNAGSWKLRPSYKTPFSNMFIATGYVKESIDIFSMEAACMAGKMVAYDISNQKTSKPYFQQRPLLFSPFREIDNTLYKLKLPNVMVVLIIIMIIIIIMMVIPRSTK